MTATVCSRQASTVSFYEPWHQHFLQNRGASGGLPWGESRRLTAVERRIVARSIQQFQLGEWARGRGLMRRASSHPVLANDPSWLPALRLFIAEEQEHSNMLGRYLDREQIPRLNAHWIDGMFRRLRKLAGLEACVTVLVTAETLAIPFYQALRDATHEPLLRAICVRILCDEGAHLKFQATTLGLIRRSGRRRARTICSLIHPLLFRGTALLLWQQHRRVFHAANWSFRRFWNEARREFVRLNRQVRRISAEGVNGADDDRLD